MARKQKNSISYFPHEVDHGKEMHYIEGKYKNDGYAVWFKLLEELGKAEYHYLDISSEVTNMYLSSSFNVSEEVLNSIINDLVKIGEFDQELYKSGILFSQKFVDSISDAYKKRTNNVITRKSLLLLLTSIGILKPQKSEKKQGKSKSEVAENTQSKVDNIKVDKKKEKDVAKKPLEDYHLCVEFWLTQFHPDWDFGGQTGKALKSLIVKIKKVMKDSNREITPESVRDTFASMCYKLPTWYEDKDLPIINQKFNEIFTQIKNNNNGKQRIDSNGKTISIYAPD